MEKGKPLDAVLQATNHRQIVEGTVSLPRQLTLPQARELTPHLQSLRPDAETLRLGFVRTYTSDLLDPWLELHAAVRGYQVTSYHAPFGLNILEACAESGLVQHNPDLTLFLLQRDDLHPELQKPVAAMGDDARAQVLSEIIARLCGVVGQFRAALEGRIVISVLPRIAPPGLGLFDTQAENSESLWWAEAKRAIASALDERFDSVILLDLDDVTQEVGRRNFFDLRYWYSSRFPFTAVAASEFAERIVRWSVAAREPKAKVIVLDADNTLWGGTLGEDGFDNIGIGPDYPGNAFVDFQRRLLDFQQRGYVLALCSKNNPEDVDEVLRTHPHQVLRDEHFAAKRVNWLPKNQNIIAIAKELNLGLDSFIFVDDSDYECGLVRREVPEVTVIQTPAKPAAVPACLDHLARLEITSLTAEDKAKTKLYGEERQRRVLRESHEESAQGIGEYLRSLEMTITVAVDDARPITRLAQLTQKTNQFNLTTRRYDEAQIGTMIASDEWLVGHFSLADIFGDSGIVGLWIARLNTPAGAQLDTFLMSCRVIGRQAESAFFEAMLRELAKTGCKNLLADYIPTQKNRLVESFLPDHRFSAQTDGRFSRDLQAMPASDEDTYPIRVQLQAPMVT